MQSPHNARIDGTLTELYRHCITYTYLNTFANGKGVGRLRQWQHYIGIAAHYSSLYLCDYQLDTGLLDNLAHLLGYAVIGNKDIDLVEHCDMAKTSLAKL